MIIGWWLILRLEMPRIERFFFLEDLQDLGDRYSPSVLGEFIATHGLSSTLRRHQRQIPATLSDYISLPDTEVVVLKRVLMLNLVNFSLSVFYSAFLFAMSPFWDSPVDPTTLGEWIGNAQPSGMCIAGVVYAILMSVLSEIYSCLKLITIRQFFSPSNMMLLTTSLISQTSTAADMMSLVILVRASKSLGYIASFALVIQVVVFGISLPLKGLLHLRGKFDGGIEQYPRYTAPGHECFVRGVSVQKNSDCLRSLAVGSVVCNWRLLDELIRSKLGSVPMEWTLLLQTIVIGYFRCFSFQLIWIPLKIFFLLDYGVNNIVLVSVPLSVFTIFLVCLTNVFPFPRSDLGRIDSTELIDVVV